MNTDNHLAKLLTMYGQQQSFQRHESIFCQGDDDGHIYFVQTGLLKAYYVSSEGKESIKSFVAEGNMIGSLNSVLNQAGCSFSLVALEASQLLRLPFSLLVDKAAQSHPLANDVIQQLLALAMKKEQREFEFLSLSAEQRYQRFLAQAPQLIDRITQSDMARYLGVTPVALSRIKKRCG